MFTVSLRDSYNNHPPIIPKTGLRVVIFIVEDGGGVSPSVVLSSSIVDIPSTLDISVIPCCIKTPNAGNYIMKIAIVPSGFSDININVLQESFASDESVRVMGSPFRISVGPPRAPIDPSKEEDSKAVDSLDAIDAVDPKSDFKEVKSGNFTSLDQINDVQQETDAKIFEVTKAESTRRRAELALRQHQLNLAKLKEDKKKSMAKRIGGGFMIQYSKDI